MSGSSEECNEYRGRGLTEREPKAGSLAMSVLDPDMARCGVFTWLMHPLFYIGIILKVKPRYKIYV